MVDGWEDAVVSDTQIIVVVAIGASVFIIFCCLVLVVLIRLNRVVKSQLKTIDNLLSARRAGREPDTPHESSS